MSRLKCLPLPLAPTSSGGWKPDSHRGNRHQRGYGSTWEKTRARIIERDTGLCQPCLRDHKRPTLGNQVDHIVSRAEGKARGWTDKQIEADENLQTICTECHKAKTSRESRGGG